jgi:DNA-binding transcriptional ArsR family regulator
MYYSSSMAADFLVRGNKRVAVKVVQEPEVLEKLLSKTRWKILKALAEKPVYPAELAKKLRLDEQKVYYHIKELKALGAISVVKTEEKQGAIAKYFRANENAYSVVLDENALKEHGKAGIVRETPKFLEEFFSSGEFDAKIIVGSPDAHGKYKARARDGYYVGDLALFLGSMSARSEPCIKLDTDVRERELEENDIILVGGPIVNVITARINEDLPVKLTTHNMWGIHSELSGETYYEDTGLVVKTQNPWNPGKSLLVVAGRSIGGTKAAILGIVKYSREIDGGNRHKKGVIAKVFEGIDLDGDGVVDSVEVRE